MLLASTVAVPEVTSVYIDEKDVHVTSQFYIHRIYIHPSS